jgi:(2R)-sulfolactate sulfo-lyase subunit alpha
MNRVLAHRPADSVGVATDDLAAGEEVAGRFLDGGGEISVRARDHVPLGHKIALRGQPAGSEVIEYGIAIGEATADIEAGDHVHVHNLRSIRWRDPEDSGKAPAKH